MIATRAASAAVALALVAGACSDGAPDDSASTAASAPTTDAATPAIPTTGDPTASAPAAGTVPPEPVTFQVFPGTEQLTVTDAEPGMELSVFDAEGRAVASGTADEHGALVVRGLDGGAIHTVGTAPARSEPVTIMTRDGHPPTDFFAAQVLPTDELGYITARDGTQLSTNVWLPGPVEDGPYPTVLEYSGYTPSDPNGQGFSTLFNALGYAYVGVNMRGTGCSGGWWDYFEYSQSLDGYDAIETVAAQPWVQDNRVGMVGVSYPGISQLFVAQTQPPSLAAISPLSVIADSAISTLYPGGILNTGFAVEWAENRASDAEPAGQQWAADRIAAGDQTCADNQLLRGQSVDPVDEILANEFWTDDVAGEVAPRLFVDRITVPTFVAGGWQDEQTGGHFATMLGGFTGTDHFYATVYNGLHVDAVSPAVLPRLVEFLDLYVAERTPSLDAARQIAAVLGGAIFGTSEFDLPADDRFSGMTHAEALAVFESETPIEVLFEVGAADGYPALSPMARFTAGFDSWPIPSAEPAAWYLGDDDGLVAGPDTRSSQTGYLALPDAIPQAYFDSETGGNLYSTDVAYEWVEGGLGTFGSWLSDPLDADLVVVGSGSVDLWLQSNLGDTDVEVTITEVTPDDDEVYVQSGWLRASHRALDSEATTELRPVHTHFEADAAPLPDGEFELVRVEIFPVAHVFRAGSRIRLIVDAPGGNRAVWEFHTIAGGEQVTIGQGTATPSRLVLPAVSGVDVPPQRPPCGALRGQPCREAAVG